MFGLRAHPTLGPGAVPVVVELLSPAQRPVQTTADLPGFWATSYADVRRDLRGRYPRHPWPEDPAAAPPDPARQASRIWRIVNSCAKQRTADAASSCRDARRMV